MLLHKVDPGFYPQDWQVSLLDQCTKRGSGHTPDKQHPEYWNGGIKWVSLADSSKLDNGLISKTAQEVSEKGIENSSAVVHPAGTVVVSRDAGVGKSAILGEEMAVSQHFIAWQCDNKKKVNSWYLYYWLQTVKRELERQAVGSTIKTIGLPYFKKILFPHPKYAEQEKIAVVLRTWDQAIETTEKLIKNSQAQKKALMQQLLTGKKRLPGFEGEWDTKTIQEIAERITRKSDGREHPVLTISSLSGFVRQDEKYSRFMAGKSVDNYILLQQGEFAYNKGNSKSYEFGCIFDLGRFETGLVPHVYVCFRLDESCDHDYYKYLFESDYLKPQLGRLVNTGVRNNGLLNIKPDDFMRTRVPLPSLAEQQAIKSVIAAASDEVDLKLKCLDALRQEKMALMQKLLTGKRRVKV